jgi:micrococcal nuclease
LRLPKEEAEGKRAEREVGRRIGRGSVTPHDVTIVTMSHRTLITLIVLVLVVSGSAVLRWGVVDTVQAQPTGETQEVSVTRVVDGDTIEVSPQVEGTEDVRLIGIDTPETDAPYGSEATEFTTERLEGQDVTLEFDEERVDPYDRALAYVWLGDELFSETLVREGYARVDTFPPNVKYEERFIEAERPARAESLGIWGLTASEEITAAEPTTSTPTSTPTPELTTSQPAPTTSPQPAAQTASPSPDPARTSPPKRGSLINAGGPLAGPVPIMAEGECPKEYPFEYSGACYAQ